ncbi:uncharacterized protein LOC135488717 [Lineus longissimus]|uniref:uncharacterized protein LOC135488717 n=1 Tax=Lineus longissimus TaxID=88925 RepID=UPI002B4CDB92
MTSFRSNVYLRLFAPVLVVITIYLLVYRRRLISGLTKKYVFTEKSDVIVELKNVNGKRTEEFPRLYEVPKCDPQVNKTVPTAVCRLLGANIDDEERRTYLRMLSYFEGLAKKRNWTYFMMFGTLLGSWRHHGFVPYDMDVDLYIDYKYRKDIINIMEEQTRFVPKQMVSDSIKIYDSKHIVGGAYYPNVGRWWAPDLDCFFYKQDATHIFRSDEPGSFVMKKTNVFPLQLRPFETLELPAPRNVLQSLVDQYGNTSICKRYARSYKPVECRELRRYIPFVYRVFKDGQMEERLILDKRLLQVKLVKELKSSLTRDPFTLQGQ